MNFIKNNKILFGAFALTLLLALVMISLDIWMYSQFGQNKSEVDAKVAEYVALTKKTPAPTKKNINTITYEYTTIQKRLNRLQRQFGRYLRNPLLKFCEKVLAGSQQKEKTVQASSREELLSACEDELLEAFRKYCDELPKEKKMLHTGQTDAENFMNFMDKVLVPMTAERIAAEKKISKPAAAETEEAKKLIQQALSDFEKDAKDIVPLAIIPTQLYPAPVNRQDKEQEADYLKRVAREISRTNGYEYLMEAMGLPRTVDIGRFQAQLKTAQSYIKEHRIIPGLASLEKESDRDALIESVTFRESDMPVQSRMVYLVRQMQVRYDIFRRLKKSGVLKIEKFSSLSPLEGTKKAERFSSYVFEIIFHAEMKSIRNLMNDLLAASNENVYYNILYAEFHRPAPEDLDKALAETKFDDPKNVQVQDENGDKEERKIVVTAADILAVGADQSVRAVLKIETIVFTGEECSRTGADAK